MRLKLNDSRYALNELAIKIRQLYKTNARFAKLAGCSPSTVTLLLSGKVSFDVEKMLLWSKLLCIPYEKWSVYFVTEEQRNNVYEHLVGSC